MADEYGAVVVDAPSVLASMRRNLPVEPSASEGVECWVRMLAEIRVAHQLERVRRPVSGATVEVLPPNRELAVCWGRELDPLRDELMRASAAMGAVVVRTSKHRTIDLVAGCAESSRSVRTLIVSQHDAVWQFLSDAFPTRHVLFDVASAPQLHTADAWVSRWRLQPSRWPEVVALSGCRDMRIPRTETPQRAATMVRRGEAVPRRHVLKATAKPRRVQARFRAPDQERLRRYLAGVGAEELLKPGPWRLITRGMP